jgi:hypothetical protein
VQPIPGNAKIICALDVERWALNVLINDVTNSSGSGLPHARGMGAARVDVAFMAATGRHQFP